MATAQPTERQNDIQFRQLLEEAVSKPGTLMKAYSLFWNYSLGNQILALFQANQRGIPLGPIASFNRWKELARISHECRNRDFKRRVKASEGGKGRSGATVSEESSPPTGKTERMQIKNCVLKTPRLESGKEVRVRPGFSGAGQSKRDGTALDGDSWPPLKSRFCER